MSAIIRRAEKKDIPAMQDIYAYYVKNTTYTFEYEVPTLEELESRFEKITEYFPWLVCEVAGKVAGYAYAGKVFSRDAYRWDVDTAVYIDKDYRRSKMGRAFYLCLEELVRKQGIYNIYAIITAENEASEKFHIQMDYERQGLFKKSGYKFGRWLDVSWYVKRIRSEDIPGETLPFVRLKEAEVEAIFKKAEKIISYNKHL